MYSNILPLVQTHTNLHFHNLVGKVVSFLQNIRVQCFMHLFVPMHHLILPLLITQSAAASTNFKTLHIQIYFAYFMYGCDVSACTWEKYINCVLK